MKKIVLISGKAEHGKDELAKFLKERLEKNGEKVVVDRFAKYIKGYLKDYYDWDGITKNKEIREIMQKLGTEKIKEDLNFKAFHAKRLAEDFQIIGDDFDIFLIPDTRFKDEVYLFKAMFPEDCITVRVNRYDFKSKLTEEQLQHKSECDLDDFNFDYKIHTRKSDIGQLHDEAERVLNKVLNIC